MAVASLISPSGILPVRDTVSTPPVREPASTQAVQQRPEVAAAEATKPTGPPEPHDLSTGFDARAERRLQLKENAEQQRLRAQVEDARQHAETAVTQLDNTRADLIAIRSLIQGSRDMEITAGKRADMEQQAIDLAHTAGVELHINDPDATGIVSIEGIGFQPNTLGLVAVRTAADEETPDTVDLRNHVSAAIENLTVVRNEVTNKLEALPGSENFPTISEQEFDGEEDQQNRVNNEARAFEVVEEIREHQVTQGEPLIHNLTTLGTEVVAALIP
jgi:uncharacterized membrane protein